MDNDQSQQTIYQKFTNFQVFQNIYQFLDITTIFKFMTTNKEISQLTQEYIKVFLTQSGHLELTQEEQKKIQSQNLNKYNLLYKYFYNREIYYMNLPSQINSDSIQNLKTYKTRKFKQIGGVSLQDFQIGGIFTVYLSKNSELSIILTKDYFDSVFPKFIVKENVKQFSINAKNFYYLTHDGEVHVIFFDAEKDIEDFQETKLEFIEPLKVDSMATSFINVIFSFQEKQENIQKNTGILENIIEGNNVNPKEIEPLEDTKQNFLVYDQQNITYENYNDHKRMKRVINYPYFEKLKKFIVGFNHAYFLTHKNEVLQLAINVEQPQVNNTHTVVKHLNVDFQSKLENKHIVDIQCGLYSYFALEREEIPGIADWSNERLIAFLEQIEFTDFVKIIKYENITGKDLVNITKNFMVNTLGITQDDLQIKLTTEIQKYIKPTFKDQKIYAWGKNDYGQLGLKPVPTINRPQQVPLPPLASYDSIKDIIIGWKNTIIISNYNKIFISTPHTKSKEKEEEKSWGAQREDKNSQFHNTKKPVKPGKKHNKKHQEKSTKLDKYLEEQQHKIEQSNWTDITQKFSQNFAQNRIISVSNTQAYLGLMVTQVSKQVQDILKPTKYYEEVQFIASKKDPKEQYKQLQISQNNYEYNDQDEVFHKQKMTKTDEVLNRFKWDEKFKNMEISVIYVDRFLGDLEVPLDQFQQSEVKVHRVKIFKINGEVYWDKEKRIDRTKEL